MKMQPGIICGYGFKSRLLKNVFREFRRTRLAKEWILFSKNKKQPVGAVSWWTSMVPNKIQSGEYSKDGGMDGSWHVFFVANVNVNSDDRLNVNVNRFKNDNVWNADNHHRVVVPKLADSPVLIEREFSFVFRSVHFSSRQAVDRFLPIPSKAQYIFHLG